MMNRRNGGKMMKKILCAVLALALLLAAAPALGEDVDWSAYTDA